MSLSDKHCDEIKFEKYMKFTMYKNAKPAFAGWRFFKAKSLQSPKLLSLKNLSSEDYGIPPVLFHSDLLHVSRQQTIFHYTQ